MRNKWAPATTAKPRPASRMEPPFIPVPRKSQPRIPVILSQALLLFIALSRIILSQRVVSAQKWTDEGPHAIVGQGGMQNIRTEFDATRPNPGMGAIKAFAALDNSGKSYMIGSSGGIWMTRNAKEKDGKVVWSVVTDGLASKFGALPSELMGKDSFKS